MGTFSQSLLINTDIMAKVHIKNWLFRVEGIKTANAKKEGKDREKMSFSGRRVFLFQPTMRDGQFYGCPEVSKSCGVTPFHSPCISRLPGGEEGLGVCTPH